MSESNVKAGVKRREFLKVLGATTAAGTAAACGPLAGDKPEKLLPYLVSPDHTVPGVSNYYASTCRECAAGCGIIVETRDGRAIKIEGNPDHPVNHGALCARGQAALQGLYNPDRYRGPMQREGGTLKPITWDAAITLLSSKLAGARGKDAVFINQHEQGSFPAFLDQWLSALGLPAHISYDAEAPLAVLAANKEAYGTAWPSLDFAAAKLIVSIGADFLEGWGHSVTQQLSWADARAKTTDAPRAVYIGARRSLTGLNSDQWIAAKPGTELQVARALLGAVGKGAGVSLDGAANASGVPVAALEALGNALKAAGNRALVVAGTTGPDAKAVALAAAEINKALGSVGVTVKPADAMLGAERLNSAAQVREALERMKSGSVPVLMVRGANIAYTSPKQSDVAGALAKVPFKVAFTSYPDETAEMCDLILPDHHSLESWGDAETVKGVLSLQQPVMDPVFNTRATADVLIAVAKKDSGAAPKFAAQDYRAWIASRIGGDAALTAALPSGMKGGTGALASASVMAAPKTSSVANPQGGIGGNGDFTLQVYFSPVLGDGRGANKPWLQELPDPVTKVLWQTVIELHPDAAKKLGVAQGDHVTVKTAAGEITAPVYLYIGLRPDTVAVAAGRGHTAYGRYAKDCGANAFALLPSGEDETGGWALTQTRATVTNASGMSRIVTTEGAARQHDRGIAQAMNVGVLLGTEKDEEHGEPEFPGDSKHEFLPGIRAPVAGDAQGNLLRENSAQQGLYDPANPLGLTKRRWAMTIDLARCTGCSACVTACYAENNIPTVGAPWQGPKVLADRTGFGANITRSREMSWIRLERYFEIDREPKDVAFNEDFETRFVPMMCQHCGAAPCEPVCPVFATYHAPDGLNVQVYNRCVGTRYCSNNCPYKVRYFNWFGYGEPERPQYAFPEPLHWQLNPDVTVRGKGVMEKCTMCVQRIRDAEHVAKLENREVKADEFTTACAQACPSRAIIFGDAASEEWTVTQAAKDRRAYHVFEELNTYTAVVYLKKVNHPAGRA